MERVLSPFATIPRPSTSTSVQLVLAGLVTVTSWVGYHSSWNRPRWFIRFPNLPLAQFLIDVLLVVDYWFLATQIPDPARTPITSPLIASLCVAIAFGFYFLWDVTALFIRKDDRYKESPLSKDVPARRRASLLYAGVAWILVVTVWVVDVTGSAQAIAVMIILCVLVISYRFVKDWFWPDDTGSSEEAPELPPN